MDNFYIKTGYRIREQPDYFIDEETDEENQLIWQPEIYAFVAYLARTLNCTHLIDIGCGRATKLVEYHPEFEIIGIDYESNIQYCKKNYSFGTWLDWNLEQSEFIPLTTDVVKNAVIICADVIEHLVDPNRLLDNLCHLLNKAPVAIISTPDRDLVHGQEHMGPPLNPHHVREWNRNEFDHLLKTKNLQPAFLGLTPSNNFHNNPFTMMGVLGNNKHPDQSLVTAYDTFKRHVHYFAQDNLRLRQHIEQQNLAHQELMMQLQNVQSHAEWLEGRVENQDQIIYELRVAVAEKDGHNTARQREVADQHTRITELQNRLDEVIGQRTALQQQISQLENELAQKADIEIQVKESNQEVNQLQSQLFEAAENLHINLETIELLRQEQNKLEEMSNQLQSQLENKENQIVDMDAVIQQKNDKIAELEIQITNYQEQVNHLNQEILQNKDTITQLQSDVEALHIQHETITAQLANLRTKSEESVDALTKQDDQILELETQIQTLKTELIEKQTLVNTLQLQVAMKSEMLQLLHARIDELAEASTS